MSDTFERVKEVILEECGGLDFESIQLTSNLIDDLGIDHSVVSYEVHMALEEEFNIDIPDEKFEQCHTVQDLVDLIDVLYP